MDVRVLDYGRTCVEPCKYVRWTMDVRVLDYGRTCVELLKYVR